ncbi:MAG: hypothetical protein O3A26_06575 [Proteobacteria bacterium]|nr:hypothetical protein [Pseudomonadota bacterium]
MSDNKIKNINYEKKIKHLTQIIKQLYDISNIEDIIDDLCKERDDDDFLGYCLFLKNSVADICKEYVCDDREKDSDLPKQSEKKIADDLKKKIN